MKEGAMMMRNLAKGLILVLTLCAASLPALAQNYEILHQDLDANRHGYTVIRVWGSHYDMGYGMGAALALDIDAAWDEIKGELGGQYNMVRSIIGATTWLPSGIEDEVDGIVDGVKSVVPNIDMDALDVKIVNSFSDLFYYGGCRSHSCWGGFVQDPVKTLSIRRLDYGTPFDVALHHVVVAWDPSDGSPRWVNLAFPAFVTVITAVNQYGTLSSLHDFGSGANFSNGVVCRSVAARHILTGMGDRPLSGHRDWAQQELSNMDVACSSFINYYAPEGFGGVFTCSSGGSCGQLRVPQSDYFNGDMILTTNTQTTGHSMPMDDGFMDPYYQQGGIKTLQSHWDLMGLTGLHLMGVEYRAEEDMTIWVHGRGRADRLELEWNDLFPATQPDGGTDAGGQDAGGQDAGGQDAGGQDAGGQDAGGGDSSQAGDGDGGGGCGCGFSGKPGSAVVLLLIVIAVLRRRTR
jgi:hypothetical protein